MAFGALGACSLVVDLDGLSDGPLQQDGAPDVVADRLSDSPIAMRDVTIDLTEEPDSAVDASIEAETGPPISFVSASKVDPATNVSAIDVPSPAGVVAGDVVVVGLFTDFAASSVQTPASFTKLSDLPIVMPTDTHGWWYVHVVGAAEPAKTTFSLASSSAFVSAVALAYRNVRVPMPVDVAAYGASQGTSYSAPSVTTTLARTMLVSIHLADDTTGATWTAPAGMTTRAVTGICAAFDRPFSNAATTGPAIATSDRSAGGENALIALAPRP
jgi:hypothetical protein